MKKLMAIVLTVSLLMFSVALAEDSGIDYRITNFEMESSPLAGLCAHLGHNACTVCCAIANRYLQSSNPDYKPAIRSLVELSVERMSTL